MFELGDIVKIKPEWRDAGDDGHGRYVVTNVNEATQRCYIKSVTSKFPFPGEELVGFDMIELVASDRVVFTVQFHRCDSKPVEEYEYHSKDDAEQHFNLFQDDNSGLYTHINLTETRIGLPEVVLQTIRFS